MSADFIGPTKGDKLGFLTNLANNGTAFFAQLGFALEADFTAFATAVAAAVTAQTDADAAFAAAKAATNAANLQIATLVEQARSAANSGRASTMSDEDLATLGITRRSLTPASVPAPVIAPVIGLNGLSPGVANVRYSTPGLSGARSKPEGVTAVQFSLRTSASELSPEAGIMTIGTKTPTIVNTALLAAGRVKVIARFMTAKGLAGPWSDPIEFNSQAV